MAIASTATRKEYTGNGVTTTFAFPYRFLLASDLVVYERTIATGAISLKSLNSDYTVVGAGEPNGGSILATTAPPNTVNWIIVRDPQRLQGVNVVNGAKIDADSAINTPLDALTLQVQRQNDRADRAMRVPDGDLANNAAMEFPPSKTRAGYGAAFDPNGNAALSTKSDAQVAAAVDTMAAFTAAANIQPATLQFDTADAMKAFAVPASLAGMLVYARGRSAVGDGGEGFFRTTTTDPGSEDSGTIFHSNTAGYYFVRQSERGNKHEKWFGVKRDGSYPDTTDVSYGLGALQEGERFFEDAGTSIRSSWSPSITPPKNVTLSGSGKGSTVDAYTSGSSYLFVFTQSNAGLTVEKLTMACTGPSASGIQGFSWASDYLTLSDIEFDGTMTDDGSVATNGVTQAIHPSATGTVRGLNVRGSVFHHCYSAYGKSNSDTGIESNIRWKDCEFHHNYGGDLQFNSPLGSQSDIVVERCYFHDPVYIGAFAGQQMGIAFAYGDNVRALYNRLDGDYYQAIHLEGSVTNFSIIGNRGTVSTSGIMLRPVSVTAYPQYGEVAGNNFSQSGTSRETVNYGIGIDSHGTGWPGAKNVDVHDNIVQGSGFAAGYLISGQYTDGPTLNRLHHNTAIGTAIGLYFPDNSAWGGIDIADNTTIGCPVHIKAAMALIESHNFVNCDPAASTSVPFRGEGAANVIAIKHSRFSFAPVTVNASGGTKDFALVRLGADDRLAASITCHAQMNNGSRMGSAFYANVVWDGTNAPTFTNAGGEAAHSLLISASKKTIGGVAYLVLTVTNNVGSNRDIAVTANIDGMYTYYGT